jgi:hypothetical protein
MGTLSKATTKMLTELSIDGTGRRWTAMTDAEKEVVLNKFNVPATEREKVKKGKFNARRKDECVFFAIDDLGDNEIPVELSLETKKLLRDIADSEPKRTKFNNNPDDVLSGLAIDAGEKAFLRRGNFKKRRAADECVFFILPQG